MSGPYSLPEVGSLKELHALAEHEGWGVVCDAACRFETPELEDFHVLWRSKAYEGIPQRSEMTPQLLKPYLRYLTLHERIVEPGGARFYRVRLMGDAIARITRAATGDTYDRFLPPSGIRKWNAMNDTILAHGRPLRLLIRAESVRKPFLIGEFFSAPLCTADGAANLIAAVGGFDVQRRWEKIAAAVLADA